MTKRPRIIGITGNIGCGKSTVVSLIAEHHQVIPISCDLIAKKIMKSPEQADMMRGVFGAGIFIGGALDFRAVADRLFSDARKRREFEKIIHPLVWKQVEECIVQNSFSFAEFALVEAAILFELGIEKKFDEIVVVVCSEAERRRRLREKRQMTDAEIDARIACQLSQEVKMARGHHLICTECDLSELFKRTESLYAALLASKRTN